MFRASLSACAVWWLLIQQLVHPVKSFATRFRGGLTRDCCVKGSRDTERKIQKLNKSRSCQKCLITRTSKSKWWIKTIWGTWDKRNIIQEHEENASERCTQRGISSLFVFHLRIHHLGLSSFSKSLLNGFFWEWWEKRRRNRDGMKSIDETMTSDTVIYTMHLCVNFCKPHANKKQNK